MATQQFRKVKLIDTQDSVYLNFCSECALARRTLKDKLPPTAINQLSLLFEDVVRNLLGEYFTLTANRILSFEERCNNQFGYIQKYREIDAVGIERSQPDLLFEIKTSSNPNPQTVIGKAKKQLRKSQKIASLLKSNLKLCIVYIDIFSQQIIQPSKLSSSKIEFCNTLNSLQKNMTEAETSCLVLSGVEVWHQAINQGLIDNSCLWTEAQKEMAENIYKRQQREALIAKGIPPEKFPEHLQPRNTKQTTPKIIQFGEFNRETSFSQAWRNARRKQS